MTEDTRNAPAALVSEEAPDAVHNADSQEVTFLELLTELARNKVLIAEVTGAAIALSLAVSLLLPVRYEAITRIMPPQHTQSTAALMMNQLAANGAGSLAALTGETMGLKNPDDLYLGMLQSRPVADAIIHQFDLKSVYRASDMTEARKKLASNTVITAEKSGLIAISVVDADRKRAAGIANAYTEQLRALTQGLAVTEASQRCAFYEGRLQQAKQDLVSAQLALEQVQKKSGFIAPDPQSRAMIESLTGLRAQIAAKQVELQALRSFSTEHNPDVELADRELSALQAEEMQLEQPSTSANPGSLGLGNVPGAAAEFLTAQNEMLYRQTLYELLIKQFDAARLDQSKEAAIIQAVEPAIEPDRKASPQRGLIVLAGTLLGFFSAVLYVLARTALRRARQFPEVDLQFSELRRALFARRSR